MFVKIVDETHIKYASKSMIINNKRVYNPTNSMLMEYGYKELIVEEQPSPYYDFEYIEEENCIRRVWREWSTKKKEDFCGTLVEEKITARYSLAQEIAILRQKDNKPDEYLEWYNYTELCKLEAKKELGLCDANITYKPLSQLDSPTEERLSLLENGQVETNERIEFVEDCLLEMSETVYGG